MKKIALVLASAALLAGCQLVPSPVPGMWYTDVKYPSYNDGASEKGPGSKSGMAECMTILGLIATGDASIETATKNGGISSINTVDHKGWISSGGPSLPRSCHREVPRLLVCDPEIISSRREPYGARAMIDPDIHSSNPIAQERY